MVILWNLKAKQELKKAYDFISKDSYQNAVKVRKEIIEAVMSLTEYPDKHQPDKYKNNNDRTWRVFEYTIIKFHIELKKTRSESFA